MKAKFKNKSLVVGLFFFLAGLVSFPALTAAQESASAEPGPLALNEEAAAALDTANLPYPGVHPDKGGMAPLLQKARKNKMSVVIWPGFQVLPGGGSRVFVQIVKGSTQDEVIAPTQVSVAPFKVQGNALVYVFPDSVVLLRNNCNPLVTTYFNSPIIKATMKKFKKRVYLVIEAKTNVLPLRESFMQQSNDLYFFFVDFEAGDYYTPPAKAADSLQPEEAAPVAPVEIIDPSAQ